VSGIIAANTNNGVGISGLNWAAKILPVRVLGRCGGTFDDITAGVLWAAAAVPACRRTRIRARAQYEPGGISPCPQAMQDAMTRRWPKALSWR
jgi:serine protease